MEDTHAHPPSLRIFFATEMWERYGFYVVQTLLALFLSLHFKWSDQSVYALVGSFTALTYVSPVIGGWIADYLIGQKRAILWGAFVLLICYLALMIVAQAHEIDTHSYVLGLTVALAGIAVGTGLLKPNISSLLGNEYPEISPRRESGFTIFYMGITSGIILGSTLPGILNEHYGWSACFVSAAIGMVVAMMTFVFGVYRYQIQDYVPQTLRLKNVAFAMIIVLFLWILSFYVLRIPEFASTVFMSIAVLAMLYFIYTALREKSEIQTKHIWVICILCIISVMFWSLYFQMFLSLTLFIARVVKQTIGSLHFPAPYYVSVQSLGAIVFGFFLTRRKGKHVRTHQGIQVGNKFLLAMLFMMLGYFIIVAVCYFTPKSILISPLYIIPAYLMISLAELFLYPVGLAAVTILSDRNKVSTMMGIFFLSLGLGGFLSGKMADITAISANVVSIDLLKDHYAHGFGQLLVLLMFAVLICGLLNILIKWLLREPA